MKLVKQNKTILSRIVLFGIIGYCLSVYLHPSLKSIAVEVFLLLGLTGVFMSIAHSCTREIKSRVACICIYLLAIYIAIIVNTYIFIYWQLCELNANNKFLDCSTFTQYSILFAFLLIMIGLLSGISNIDSDEKSNILDRDLELDGVVFRNCEESDKHFLKKAFGGKELPWNHVNTDALDEEIDYAESLKTILMHFDGLSIYSMVEQNGECQGIVWLERMHDRAELHCVFTEDIEKVLEIIEKHSLYYMDMFGYQKLDLSISYV